MIIRSACASDWSDYIGYDLPPEKRIGRPSQAKYIIENSTGIPSALKSKELWNIGALTMLPEDSAAQYAQIAGAEGGYDRKTSPNRWWHWVRRRIDFAVKDTGGPAAASRKISFEYWLSPDRSLALDVVGQHDHIVIDLPKPRAVGVAF